VFGGELVQLDPLGQGQAADVGGGQAGDPELVGSGPLDPRLLHASAGERGQWPIGLGGPDRHPDLPVGELAEGALADQAASVEDHHLVDQLLDLGEDMAGDQHGPALAGQ
jgi:hypothetical protein